MTAKQKKKRARGAVAGRGHRLELVMVRSDFEAVRTAAREAGLPPATWAKQALRKAAGLVAVLALAVLFVGCGASYQRRLHSPVAAADGSVWFVVDEEVAAFGGRSERPYRCAEREGGTWACRVVIEAGAVGN